MESAPQAELDSLITNSCNTHEPDNASKCDKLVKICPLCNSDVKLFFINFNEKMLMCENTDCEYPFGYEPLQFFKEDNELDVNDEVKSIRTTPESTRSSETNGTMSAKGNTCLEIDKLNIAAAGSMSTAASSSSEHSGFLKKTSQTFKSPDKPVKPKVVVDEAIQKNIQAITKLSTQLSEPVTIKNKNYLRKLQDLQRSTTKEIIKTNEILNYHRDERPFGGGELKIDISTNANEMASITIELNNSP